LKVAELFPGVTTTLDGVLLISSTRRFRKSRLNVGCCN
jgi:hypothetical protein